ncbi:MAG: hypothetical protein LBR47_07985 [Spirochaetaceae bacterium]|jgi:hypothetical protein|nr:hypothetical protein [Spirochaetaceae bacterium]
MLEEPTLIPRLLIQHPYYSLRIPVFKQNAIKNIQKRRKNSTILPMGRIVLLLYNIAIIKANNGITSIDKGAAFSE